MSYNPAFVSADELGLAGAACNQAARGHSTGIKLTSFKALANQSVAADQQQVAGAGQAPAPAPASKTGARKSAAASGRNFVDNSNSASVALIDHFASSYSNTNSSSSTNSIVSSQSSSASSTIITTNANNNNNNKSGLCAAIECRDMRYHVGRGSNKKTILHDINVTVPEGSIYGLLGPSGCGKTTMLRCVVGRITPKSGQVRVFGYKPNQAGSRIPGPAIGYMPQVSCSSWG